MEILTKYKFTSGNISGGFTGKKDAGEKLFQENPITRFPLATWHTMEQELSDIL